MDFHENSSGTESAPPPSGGVVARPSARPRKIRSAVTNNTRSFIRGDGNSPWARRYRDLIALHVDDLGGPDVVSEAQLSLCRRLSALEVEAERMEGQLSMGCEVDLDLLNRIGGNIRRGLETIGMHRVQKDVTSSVVEHFRRKPERRAR